MHVLPLSEFRANASAMLDLVARGESVRILRHGKPVADLVPVRQDAGDVSRLPSWKRPIQPLQIQRQDQKSAAQLVVDERESAR